MGAGRTLSPPSNLHMGQFLLNGLTLFAAEEGVRHGTGNPLTTSPQGFENSFVGFVIYLVVLLASIAVLMVLAKKGINNRVFKNKITQWFEQLFLFIENMCRSVIGPHGVKYVPFIFTLWIVIFCGNVFALFMPYSVTADLSFNLGMAVLTIAYVQYEGAKMNGLFGHIKHFSGPKLPLAMVGITLLIFVIEIVSELMKNLSLSLRLFGNIHGGHLAIMKMNELGEKILVPFGSFLLPIKLLTCVVQALIFTLLSCVYISLVTHHEEGHDEHGSEPAHAH